jgi:Cu+-exporting ATPase
MDSRLLLRGLTFAVLLTCVLCVGACAPAPAAIDGGGAAPAADGPSGVAVVSGAVQTISVDLSQGYYDPTVIEAKAGVPLEITFGQGQGCLAKVLIPAFSVDQDLTAGGAVVRLPAMQPGEYEFSCGMRMVFGTIRVK